MVSWRVSGSSGRIVVAFETCLMRRTWPRGLPPANIQPDRGAQDSPAPEDARRAMIFMATVR